MVFEPISKLVAETNFDECLPLYMWWMKVRYKNGNWERHEKNGQLKGSSRRERQRKGEEKRMRERQTERQGERGR